MSDRGLHSLPMSHKSDAILIWVEHQNFGLLPSRLQQKGSL